MSVTANLTTNVETITATIVVEDETIIAQVNTAARGPAGGSVINAATQSDGTAALYLDSIRFEATNGGPTQLGEMAWESNDGSIDAMLESGVIVAMGEDLVIRVRNTTASPITKGTALAYDGTSGASGRIEVKPWVGANIPTAKLFLGFAACDMPANSNGYSQWFGKLTEINTSGGAQTWLDEQIIYAVPGASATLTNVAPTSGEYAAAAVVINAGSGTSGILFVRPTFEVASSTSATANTLVLRDANGGASFGPLSALAGSSNQHSITSSAGTNIVGPLALSGSTGDTLTATYNAAITLNSTTGVNVNGGPLTLTQTWNDAAVTYTGLQVNVTDSGPSNPASLLMDLRVGGVSRFKVDKAGVLTLPAFPGKLIFSGAWSMNGSSFGLTMSSSAGSDYFRFTSSLFRLNSSIQIGWVAGNDPNTTSDLLLARDSANTLAQRNGVNAQESRIYGTYTDGSNYRRLALKMDTAGVAQIVAEGGGAGAADNRLEFVTGGATRMTVAADGVVNVSGAVTAAGNVTLGTASAGSTLSFVPRSAQNITQLILSTASDEMIIGDTAAGKRVIFGGGAQNNFMRSSGMSTAGLVVGATSAAVSGVAYIAGTLGVGIAAPTTALDVGGSIKASGTVQTGGYTFATLPTPTTGMRAYITDGAALPLYMANAAGGGSTVTPVFYNGTNWINA
jgi:hypothetical protein